VLTASRDRIVRLWTADGERIPDDESETHDSFLTDAVWDAEGTRFAVVSEDHRLSVHDSVTREHVMFDAGTGLKSVAWNHVTVEIAVGRADCVIVVYDCAAGLRPTELAELTGHTGPVLDLAWSPDGSALCAASADWRGTVWDVGTGAQLTTLVGHSAPVTGCRWLTDDTVATCGVDRAVRIWDVSDAWDAPAAGLARQADRPLPSGSGYAHELTAVLRNRLGH
jgi:WD40 repeat protein